MSTDSFRFARAQQLACQATCAYCVLSPREDGAVPATIVSGPDKRFVCSSCGKLSWPIPSTAAALFHQPAEIKALVASLSSADKERERSARVLDIKGAGVRQSFAQRFGANNRRMGLIPNSIGAAASLTNAFTVIELGYPSSTEQVLVSIRYSPYDLAVAGSAEPLVDCLSDLNRIGTVAGRQAVARLRSLGFAVVTVRSHGLKQSLVLAKGRQIGPEQYAGIIVQIQSEPL